MNKQEWKIVQRQLLKLGYNPGPIDGIRGRLTTAAVIAFQQDRGLLADGIVGPQTKEQLFANTITPAPGANDDIPWYREAVRLVGLKEDPRKGHSNEAVEDLADTMDIDYDSDDIPWCGLFVGHCIGATLPNEPLPNRLLAARSWGRFGMEATPQLGAILVFWRGSPDGWQGHVGFYAGEDKKAFRVLGGNQSNAVSYTTISKKRLLTARWPMTAMVPQGDPILFADLGGNLSTNEA